MNTTRTITMRMMAVILSALLILPSIHITTYASSKIGSIGLTFSYDTFEEGDDDDESDVSVSVSSASAHYSIDEIEITNMPSDDSWNSGTTPKLRITLYADNGYTFESISSGDCSFSGSKATYSSSSRKDDNETLVLTVKLRAVDGDDDDTNSGLEVSDLDWDEDNARAEWTGADDAEKYYVKLYRNNSSVDTYSTTNTYYNMSSKITSTGTYYFKVRAYDGDDYGDWDESDTFYVDSSTLNDIKSGNSYSSGGPGSSSSSSGAWLKDNVGWWYCNADRSYTVNNWQYIGNLWYYFNASGYMVTGWVQWKGIWYYLGSDGAMLTNTTTPDGYRVDGNGAWIH